MIEDSKHRLIFLETVLLCFVQPSVFELARTQEFSSLPVIVEDFIKDHGGQYNSLYTDYNIS